MAEILLSPLLQICFDKLASSALHWAKVATGFNLDAEMKKLESTLRKIEVVLEDAEEQQGRNKLVKLWLEELRDAAYDAEDLLEGLMAECNSVVPITTKGKDLQQIQNRLDDIVAAKFNFQFNEVPLTTAPIKAAGRKQTGSFTVEPIVYGRTGDMEEIIKLLLETNSRTISIVPIVGIGGMGKTTLARLAYNDNRIKENFDLKMWVCVMNDFDVVRLIKSIIESATKSKCEDMVIDALQYKLWGLLNGKKFLLVLDDVWNEDQQVWDEFKSLLTGAAEGSRVIVTTRSNKVATIMGTTPIHHVQELSPDDCWALFKQRAFGDIEDEIKQHEDLIVIGKQIVKKCGGVPLAAKSIGSLLRFKRGEREWLSVQESELWNIHEEVNGILPALRLSYNHLPSYLKPCFAYCSLFPKNFEIKKEKLIHQWIAQGFVNGYDKDDTGEEYFNDLVALSFFQGLQVDDDGRITECKMHDIIHDLATSVAGKEFITLEHGHEQGNFAQTRHSSVILDFKHHEIPKDLSVAKKLRTLLLSSTTNLKDAPPLIFSSFPFLRVLNLSGCGIEFMPRSICNLKLLRYLDLSYNFIKFLPSELTKLFNLQTLDLSYCDNLIELPGGMFRLYELRYLDIAGCKSLMKMPNGGFRPYLQKLPIFIVSDRYHGRHGISTIKELKHMNYLKGELQIQHLENVKDINDVKEACLESKGEIHSLGLSWGKSYINFNEKKEFRYAHYLQSNDQSSEISPNWNILESLKPSSKLKKLFIHGYKGIMFPSWIGNHHTQKLTEVVLINCNFWLLPRLEELHVLKVLYMHGMHSLGKVHNNFYGISGRELFPSLKELTLKDIPNLKDSTSVAGEGVLSSLLKITIHDCPLLKTIPWAPSLQYLELQNCDARILNSGGELTSLCTVVINAFPELSFLPEGLLENSPNLTFLKISSCPNLLSLPAALSNLRALKSLTIRWCQQLASLPELQNLGSLESLEISDCHSIASFPEEAMQGLISLRSLSIENCNSLTSLPGGMQNLTALENLTVMYCPKLVSLPEDLQQLTALRSMIILSCSELKTLPEGLKHVTTLQILEIRSCSGLLALPTWIENLYSLRSLAISDCPKLLSLPEGLQSLNALQHLSVQECPYLEIRCRKRGADWHKISHIPHIYIGGIRNLSNTAV